MRWIAGWWGLAPTCQWPKRGRAVPGLPGVWISGWAAGQVRTIGTAGLSVTVVGECGAGERELGRALSWVRAGDWRALTRWPGSYLTIARYGQEAAVIGDLAGQHPVYWRPFGGGVWWASTQSALAALDGAAVDLLALAAHLAFGQPHVLATRSLFSGVDMVPGGHMLLLAPGGARTERYEPAEYAPVDLPRAAPAVAAALTGAVAARLHDRVVSADLAGLDSTTLACLAAQRGQPVTAVTFADERIRDDDLAYARRTAAAVPGLRHHVVRGRRDCVFYDGLDDLSRLPVMDAPSAYTVTASIKRATLGAVTGRLAGGGPGVHFIGEAGDVVLSASSSYLADLWRAGSRRRAWRHTIAHARLQHTSPLSLWRRSWSAARTGLAAAWRQCATQLRDAPRAWAPHTQRPMAWTPLLACADWMPPGTRQGLARALEQAAADLTDAPRLLATWTDRQDLARIGCDLGGWRAMVHGQGIELAAPYLDNEVIRACLAVPAHQRGVADRYKPLLAAAFPADRGPVPDFVLARTTKGGLDGVSYAGYRANAPVLHDLLGPSSRLAGLGLLSLPPVHEQLARAAAGQPAAQGALHLAVATEVWLRQQPTATGTWWTQEGEHRAAT